ncbi:MAG: folate family ECF transporter S component [Clostridia bacterium]|nr:folate family ECF transporter S component [Clostridia bacterium]
MSTASRSPLQRPSVFSATYWKEATGNLKNPRMLALAAFVIALRAVCKMLEIPLAPGLNINVAAFFNAVGAMAYGPVVGVVGAIASDPLGYLLHPDGPYFLPFMLVDMSSSFIFGLFFWKRPLTVGRTLTAKFTVNMVSNVVLTSLIMKWYYLIFYGVERAEAYNLINLTRIVKNLVMFPIEAILIAVVLGAVSPALYSLRLLPEKPDLKLRPRHYVAVALLTLLAVGLVLFYIFFLKDFVKTHNIKLF